MYTPKRGPWTGIEFRSQYDYRKFDANPALHPYWDRLPQFHRWTRQYDNLHNVPPEDSMRKGSEFRHHLDRMLTQSMKGR